jgi:hypothetical protein
MRRWLLATCLAAGGPAGAAAQTVVFPSTAPQKKSADYLAMVEIQRELQALQPLFVHVGVSILLELRDIQKRPEASPGPWVEPIRRKYTSRAGRLALALPLEASIAGRAELEKLSADERVVRRGGVQRLLIRLAIAGRINRQEYEAFVRRLRGN